MPNDKIINHVRRFRFDNEEMTQQELADLSLCTRQTIIALEQGKYVPSLTLAFRISSVLKAALEDVFEYQSD
ncbi:helix-turn-helix transcriptional regulator [Acidobacteriota bacterium]